MHRRGMLLPGLLSLVLAWTFVSQAKPPKTAPKGRPAVDRDTPDQEDDGLDDLLEGKDRGTRFVLVNAAKPDEELAGRLYWRRLLGVVAAETTPVEFRLGGQDVIAPRLETDDEDGPAEDNAYEYPSEGYFKLENGRHVLTPGDIPVEVKGGVPSSPHPAVKVVETKAGREVRILCRPVRFEAVDEAGAPTAQALTVNWNDQLLLRKAVSFSRVAIWLPVGIDYTTNLGSFTLGPKGELLAKKQRLTPGVTVVDGGLRKTVPVAPQPGAASATTSNLVDVTVPSTDPKIPEARYPRFRLYCGPVVAPGKPVWCGLSRQAYREATGRDFAAGQFSWQVDYAFAGGGAEGRAPVREVADAPSDETVKSAANALNVKPAQIGWLRLPLPEALAGPVTLLLHNKHASSVRLTVLIADTAGSMHLVPYRWRVDYAQPETAVYQIFVPKGTGAAEATIYARLRALDDARPIVLGHISLPAVEQDVFDSRVFALRVADLPAGTYDLWAEAGSLQSGRVPLRVVEWSQRSPFMTHSMSGCTACWPVTEEGLQVLEDADLQMATATGAWSMLNTALPHVDAALAGRLSGLPAELAMKPTGNDLLLARMLRHKLRLIDLAVVRDAGMYNEGLSYHHSYQPSVDRMIRRMQLFTQQTGDYASFYGINYSWFPQMYGYAEGGVPTDAHVADRNRVLAENVKAAGFEPLTADELKWYHEHKFSNLPAEREKSLKLQRQAVSHWKASNELGWGRHNKLYDDAMRQVRPDLAFTLFENAGHDEGKRCREQFNDLSAVCYESYTDHGDWPMSAAFATDWAQANAPGKPVWLTTCWGTSSEGKMKSLFHAFARGLAGGGVPLEGTFELDELARRGTGMKFISQYGTLAGQYIPDRRVAILSRGATQVLTPRGMWYYHALYSHLTRLGFPPILVADDEVCAAGIPDHIEVLFLAQEQQPLDAETLLAIKNFVDRGGKLITVGSSPSVVDGSLKPIVIDRPLKQIWELAGFMPGTHQQLWQEFEQQWREPLTEALSQAGVIPLATTDWQRGFAVAFDSPVIPHDSIRYVAVIADAAGTHSNEFVRQSALPVSLAGTGWIVRDLAKQLTLDTETRNGRTEVQVDLSTEPTTLLALLPAAPGGILLDVAAARHLGEELTFRCEAESTDGKFLPPIPLRYTLFGPDKQERGHWYRSSLVHVRVPLALHDEPGNWQLSVQELLTGLQFDFSIDVQPAAAEPVRSTLATVGDVHVVNADHLRQFTAHSGPKLVIVEPGQEALLPIAQKLTDDLMAAGAEVRLWQVQPAEYDTIPVRFYPRPEDTVRLEQIAAGKLIGYRENMQAYIDKSKRTHVPERGGYAEIQPAFMVGQDCIVFSGGKLAESLRAVSPWLASPHSPGREQGRLVTCFSPFMANCHAAVVVAHDSGGRSKAADRLVEFFRSSAVATAADVDITTQQEQADAEMEHFVVSAAEAQSAPRPYGNYSPIQRAERLLATADGHAVVLLNGEQDNVALVNAAGDVTGTVHVDGLLTQYARIDGQGRLINLVRRATAMHPAWNFPTEIELTLQTIGTSGSLEGRLRAFTGRTETLPPDYESAFALSPDGKRAVLGQPAGLLIGGLGEWQRYDDRPQMQQRFEALFPRFPVGATLSSDGRFLLTTFDSRPALGAFSIPAGQPYGCETALVDLSTGERVWGLRGEDFTKSSYAVHSGFAAVSRDGNVTALADFNGFVYLVDKSGKAVLREQVTLPPMQPGGRLGPPEGVGVWMDENGQTAAFGFKNSLAIARIKPVYEGKTLHLVIDDLVRVPVSGIVSGCVSSDGSFVAVTLSNGKVQAYGADGAVMWTMAPGGTGNRLAAIGENRLLVATGDGDLVCLDADGQEVRRTSVIAVADQERHELQPAEEFKPSPDPFDYQEPSTLVIARQRLKSEQRVTWKPQGPATELSGRKFYLVEEPIELKLSDAEECFVHLVYRRPEENKSLMVKTSGQDGDEQFLLDLPTPQYRVVDLPIRGPKAQATIVTDGPVQIAECSFWSIRWPGPNLAFVEPPDLEAGGDLASTKPAKKNGKSAADDLLEELGDEQASGGAMKALRIYWWNSDPDQIAGTWRKPPLDPTQIVDRKRFGGGKLAPWADFYGAYAPTRGGFFTIGFSEPTKLSLVATYDRAAKQSEVGRNLAVFDGHEPDDITSGRIYAGAVENDQFWRLFPLEPGTKIDSLGVHLYSGSSKAVGLSEIEAYK